MLISDLFYETTTAILSNKLRSGLTILGIVIGIGSVIAMISIGTGSKSSIESRLQSMGTNVIYVTPGMQMNFSPVSQGRGTAQSLTIDDVKAIQDQVVGVSNISPITTRRFQVIAKSQNTNTQVIGVYPSYPSIQNIELETGLFFTENDLKENAKVAILGSLTRDDLFGEGYNPVGNTIKINGIIFKVIGVMQSKGGALSIVDDQILIPYTTAQRYLTGVSKYVSSIYAQAENEKVIDSIKEDIENLLLQRHNIFDTSMADFTIVTQKDILDMASTITDTLTILLASIAGISLLVGGIGIMNMMMTSVNERFREIGLRKAVGAKNKEITLQFLMEAIFLSLIGGVIGILFGMALAYGVTFFTSLPTEISLSSILLACGVSSLIGMAFGYWPAKKAADLNPIQTLRYE